MFKSFAKYLRRRRLARTKAAYQGQIDYLRTMRQEDLTQIFQIERLIARIELEERKLQTKPGERKTPEEMERRYG